MLSVRPKIAELVFQLYGRNLHPELFEVHRRKSIERADYNASIQITSAGHLVRWEHEGLVLTEIATSAHHPLPQKRRLMSHQLRGARKDRVECRAGITYTTEFSLETVSPEAFFVYQKEFALAGASGPLAGAGLLHKFDASGRFGAGMGAMSYVHVESRQRTLKVLALHTFPDDYAIVKSQSVFALPKK